MIPPRRPRTEYASLLDLLLGAAALLAVVLLPLLHGGGFRGTLPNVTLYVCIYVILGLGLNVVVGFTGLLDLGYVAFLATGALLTGFLLRMTTTPDGVLHWRVTEPPPADASPLLGFDGSYLLVLLASGIACALLGVLRGIPTLRVRGDYYAIMTLGFAEILFETALWDRSYPVDMESVTGGTFGVKLSSLHVPRLFGRQLFYDEPVFYYLVVGVVVATFVAVHHVNRSRFGRALASIRLDETAARACGVDVARHKLAAFAISGFVGGVGGSLYALNYGTVAAKGLDVWQSVLILCGVVLGGMGSIRGAAFGVGALMALGELLREDLGGVSVPPEARFLIYGLLLIVVMRFRPQGLLPPVRHGRPVTWERDALLAAETPLCSLPAPAEERA